MSRRPAIITQADVARCIRAAKREGASSVEVKPDGSISIRLIAESPQVTDGPIEPIKEIIL